MRLIPISAIQVSTDRQRKEFDEVALGNLSRSIASVGLMNPLIVTQNEDGVTFLVAGERRLRAIKFLALTDNTYRHGNAQIDSHLVPVIDFSDLSDIQRQELELEENIARQDLTWQERVAAIARLDSLRALQQPGHTVRDTAAEIHGVLEADPNQTATTTRALVLAKAAARDPEIAGAKTEREAYKLLTRKEERERFQALAISESTAGRSDTHILANEECLSWMARQPDGFFNIILTDPPYGMGADGFGDAAGKLSGIEHHYDDSAGATTTLLSNWFPEAYRIAAPNAFLFLWCDIDFFPTLKALAILSGWKPHRTPFINVKREGGRVPWPTQGPRRCYELCLYAVKGDRPTRSIVRDAFESSLSERNYGHGAQKPVEAYEYLLRMVAIPGDVALDTFAGTGTLIQAAENVGIRSVNVEQDQAHYGIMKERLSKLQRQDQLSNLLP